MNINYDGTTVSFKTEPKELFEAEKSGAKPNTVRILDTDEYHQLRKHNPKKIIVQHQQEVFLRTITNIHATKGVFGKVIVVISWTNERHHHSISREPAPHGPGDHTQSLDKEPEIPVIPSINLRSGGKVTGEVTFSIPKEENAPTVGAHSVPVEPGPHNASVDSVPEVPIIPSIKDDFHVHTMSLDEVGGAPLSSEEPSIDEGFVTVEISNQMFNALQNFRHGCSINYTVQELYKFYVVKRAEERGPLHD